MRLQIASDLHLEFHENREYIKLNPLKVEGDILILAGDVATLRNMGLYRDFFDFAADNYRHTYWVPGNHDITIPIWPTDPVHFGKLSGQM